jgi:hypothetical protein
MNGREIVSECTAITFGYRRLGGICEVGCHLLSFERQPGNRSPPERGCPAHDAKGSNTNAIRAAISEALRSMDASGGELCALFFCGSIPREQSSLKGNRLSNRL